MKPYFFHSKSKIIPSINLEQISDLQSRVNWVNLHSERVHIDVEDGIFVKNKSPTLSQLLSSEYKPWVDVHLMVTEPLITLYKQSDIIKINRVYFHKESKVNPLEMIKFCQEKKIKVGMAVSVESNINTLKNYLSMIESVLIMTVNLGESGGRFEPSALRKINELRDSGFGGKIIIDGGINNNSICEVVKFMPDGIISGNYIFKDIELADKKYLELDKLANY